MLRRTRPIWNCAKVVIMDIGFCVTNGLVELLKKEVFGAALIKECRYFLVNIKGDAINAQSASKKVGTVDAVNQVEDGVAYHESCMKDLD